ASALRRDLANLLIDPFFCRFYKLLFCVLFLFELSQSASQWTPTISSLLLYFSIGLRPSDWRVFIGI
ncbi:MAG TPA: hypothetical protein VK208_01970, partial [Pyrinomonadaceae bacterium]|nr:hypothetical protein [Pyrinomonadaceae bacterium]